MSTTFNHNYHLNTWNVARQIYKKFQNQTTAFITLSTTSPLEMHVPAELDQKIRNSVNVTSVTITNAQNCILGVPKYDSCVLVTMQDESLLESFNITKIQT